MAEVLVVNVDVCYGLAEEKAGDYFHILREKVLEKVYVPTLTRDIQSWKQDHIRQLPTIPFLSRKKKKRKSETEGYHQYIRWLNLTGKLDSYLDRSISYIYMRDLGMALDSAKTQLRIKDVVAGLKDSLIQSSVKGQGQGDMFSQAALYRWAQKEGVESAFIWVMDKLKLVSSNLPDGMDAEHAQRKLIKIIAGVIMHQIEELQEGTSPVERTTKLDQAIRLGYSYGLTYPFIDDLLDANILSAEEEKQYSELIRTTLTTGTVPERVKWDGRNKDLLSFIHSELRDAFRLIQNHQQPESLSVFYEQAYVFFKSQEEDRLKELSNPNYTNEELYIPIILKSSSSRLIVRSVISAPEDEGFDTRTFLYGIYNQLADDFADMFDDFNEGAVTPYTYFLKHHEKRKDLLNPFELYWTVISHLIHDVFHSDRKTTEVILDRAINGLKRFKIRMGEKKYNEVMKLFASGDAKFNRIIQKVVIKANDVDFFDKLLRDHFITNMRNNRMEREGFSETIETARGEINKILAISENETSELLNEQIIEAANYSLDSDGKRLRPILTWVMGVQEYGLDSRAIAPLLRSLEYMHTASLIFDDLPSQDNASIRRGRPTLHRVFNSATAELTGVFLTQKAIEEQASLREFDSNTVLKLIQYSAHSTEEMCRGQAMDLNSKGKSLTLEQLNRMSYYKTGIAFEASLIMPAILAHAGEQEMSSLKKFAYHSGIAFQIKDDLLDVEGDINLLGKSIGKDAENNNSTFVSILGTSDAKEAMWEHYCLATEALQELPRKNTFLKHFLDYIVNRNH